MRNRKGPGKIEQTDMHLLDLYRQLPPAKQREYFHQIMEEARELKRVIEFDELLGDPEVVKEVKGLAAGGGIATTEMAQALNPFRYSAYFARGKRCTLAKITSVDFGRFGDVADLVILVKAKEPVIFEHRIIPTGFEIHLLRGTAEIERSGARAHVETFATIEPGEPVKIRLEAGCWLTYAEHPLVAYISRKARMKETA